MEPALDLITNLPDQILLQILSFLSLKEAIRTTALSTSFRTLCSPQNLCFNINSNQAPQFIANFLNSYNFPEISKLSLKISQETKTPMEEKLYLLATKGVAKELHLNFLEQQRPQNNFNLKLKATPQNPLINPTKFSSFSSVKILNLRSVSDLAANVVEALFSNFGSLEFLKIEKCVGLRRLDVKMGGSLKRLRVVDCPDLEDLSVRAKNLRSFCYRGSLARIELKDAHQVFDVMLDMIDGLGKNGFDCEEVLLLLEALKDVEVLTLSGWLLEWLCSAGVIFKQLGFRFSKLKELQWTDSSINRTRRNSMAYFLDICPSLERLFINLDGGRKSLACPHFHLYWHEPYFEMDYATLKNSSLQVKTLKVIKMEGFKKEEEEELLLLDLLLNKAPFLRSMSVTCVDKNSWEVVKIPLTQLKVTARRQPKQTTTMAPLKDYYFGFVEEDESGLSMFHGQVNG
ncbi:hypothetical protein LguiA_032217 [Lonicera macranthoides]